MHISITENSYNILKSHHSEKTAVNISVDVPEGPPTPGHISGTNRLHASSLFCWNVPWGRLWGTNSSEPRKTCLERLDPAEHQAQT